LKHYSSVQLLSTVTYTAPVTGRDSDQNCLCDDNFTLVPKQNFDGHSK